MDKSSESPDEEKPDLFYRGVIARLFPGNNMGVVRTESKKEIPFSYNLVLLVGEIKSPKDLKEGQQVGFDMDWTSSGLRVTKIKTYPASTDRDPNLGGC